MRKELKVRIGENKKLTSSAADAEAAVEEAERLREQLDEKIQEADCLSSELIVLQAAVDSDDAVTQIARDTEGMKCIHHMEIEVLKKQHAKERDDLVNAYENNRVSNDDLEASLEELVQLMEAERDTNGSKAKELKMMNKKYNNNNILVSKLS